jgi:hypothetical protein
MFDHVAVLLDELAQVRQAKALASSLMPKVKNLKSKS